MNGQPFHFATLPTFYALGPPVRLLGLLGLALPLALQNAECASARERGGECDEEEVGESRDELDRVGEPVQREKDLERGERRQERERRRRADGERDLQVRDLWDGF